MLPRVFFKYTIIYVLQAVLMPAPPGVGDLELVNGGYGIKHPLLRHSDVTTRHLVKAQQLGQPDTVT